MCQSGIFVRDNINHIIGCIQAVKIPQAHQRGDRHKLDSIQVDQHKMKLISFPSDQRVPRRMIDKIDGLRVKMIREPGKLP